MEWNPAEKEWFAQNVEQMKQTMFRVAYAMLRNESDCSDAASSAILKAYQNLHKLRDREKFRAWFMKILRNECLLLLRNRKVTVPLEEHLVAKEQNIADIDLHNALFELKADYRIALTLYYLEGYTLVEIAAILQVPLGTMKSRLSRARQKLKEHLVDMEELSQ